MNRKWLLFILLPVFGLCLVWAFTQTPVQERVPPLEGPVTSSRRSAPTGPAPQPMAQLRLDLLARAKEPFPGTRRDLFGPLFPPEPPPTPPKPSPAPEPLPPPPPEPVPVLPEEPPEMREELARFRFIGFLVKDEKKTVFLGTEGDIFVVGEGGRFGERKQFLVADLSPERLVIRQAEHSSPIIIPLMEQQPLVPVSGGHARAPRSLPPSRSVRFPAREITPQEVSSRHIDAQADLAGEVQQ